MAMLVKQRDRVVFLFDKDKVKDLALPYDDTILQRLLQLNDPVWKGLNSDFPTLTVGPLYTSIPITKLRKLTETPPRDNQPAFAFIYYYVVECPQGSNVPQIVQRLKKSSLILRVYRQAPPAPPPTIVNPDDDERIGDLRLPGYGYVEAAPLGIDARWVWNVKEADGKNVGFVDLEQGWFFDHEDISLTSSNLIWGVKNSNYLSHGTSVLGIVLASDNMLGGIGLAPQCSARVVSQLKCETEPNCFINSVSEAILQASLVMNAGDVLLIEAQRGEPLSACAAGPPYVPVEVEPDVHDAIRLATTNDITVVEAAGNYAKLDANNRPLPVNLDQYAFDGKRVLNKNMHHEYHGDSGAILVAGATADAGHSRAEFSNYGSRVNCFAWGEKVDAPTWTKSYPHDTNKYTTFFNGTSSASAIIAGAAVLLQSCRRKYDGTHYSPERMRELLSDAKLNTASSGPSTELIGHQPNLRAIIELEMP